jgi:hypothetical protein
MLGARIDRSFTWRGHRFPEGRLLLLDVHGTNHDPTVWRDPDAFDPTRFLGVQRDRFAQDLRYPLRRNPTPQRVPHRQPPPRLTRHRHVSAGPTGAADCEPAPGLPSRRDDLPAAPSPRAASPHRRRTEARAALDLDSASLRQHSASQATPSPAGTCAR